MVPEKGGYPGKWEGVPWGSRVSHLGPFSQSAWQHPQLGLSLHLLWAWSAAV